MLPSVQRVSIDENLAIATAGVADPVQRAALVASARHLEPLRKIQVAFDQMVRNVEDDLRARPDAPSLSASARTYIDAEFDVVRRHLAVLDAAATAGHAMADTMAAQMKSLEPQPGPPASPESPESPAGETEQVSRRKSR